MTLCWILLFSAAALWGQVSDGGGEKTPAQSTLSDFAVSVRGASLHIAPGAARIGNTTHNLSQGASVSIVGGTPEHRGACRVYLSDHGSIILECPTSSGLKFGPCRNCTVAMVRTPAVPEGAVPIAEVQFEPGTQGSPPTWESVRDLRAFLSNRSMQAGTGMALTGAGGVTTIAIDTATVPTLGGTNAFTGSVRMQAATQTAPHRLASRDPEKCDASLRETYRNTVTNRVRVCVDNGRWIDEPAPAGAWFPVGGGGNGGWLRTKTAVASKVSAGDSEWDTFAFAKNAAGPAVLHYRLPDGWDGTLSLELLFTASSAGQVTWSFETACLAVGDALPAASFGRAQHVAGRLSQPDAIGSVETAAAEMKNCRAGSLLLVRVGRAGGDKRDTLAGVAHLLGVRIGGSK